MYPPTLEGEMEMEKELDSFVQLAVKLLKDWEKSLETQPSCIWGPSPGWHQGNHGSQSEHQVLNWALKWGFDPKVNVKA